MYRDEGEKNCVSSDELSLLEKLKYFILISKEEATQDYIFIENYQTGINLNP